VRIGRAALHLWRQPHRLIAFELFGKHAEEMCAAASRALDTEPYAERLLGLFSLAGRACEDMDK
jgi:hypothetical protein